MSLSFARVTVNPWMLTYDLALIRKPLVRCDTRTAWLPGFPPPALTYRPVPVTTWKLMEGMRVGSPVAGVRRAPSRSTCMAVQFTVAASQVLVPETWDQSAGFEKSSAPSTITPGPEAWITNGDPDAPEAGTVTCSR